ncbi:UV radiation resistance-associated gene protein [Agrilus planipennis]|uniref:UV radiation resistance-associated gene protein n=1 Tax=Agrilus planipennis TaxID=224129 RepID=A0A7F5R403_AGRPL|nr:UV radiation resistance-associated gene protein [Agrilus planipennis]
MNIPAPETIYGRQGCYQWTPLFTQQLRLRHLQQIVFYNVEPSNKSKLYFTLHLSAMCSPFYTSDIVEQGYHQRWINLDFKTTEFSSVSMFVIRIWQKQDGELDVMVLSWGINLSGLVYLGNKILDIQPESFKENTVIFQIREGFFTSHETLRSDLQKPLPFIDNINLVSNEHSTNVYRHIRERYKKNEVKNSYDLKKLLKMHSLQISLRNKLADVQLISEKISVNCGMCGLDPGTEFQEPDKAKTPDTAPLLTMNTLNKMLGKKEKPTKAQVERIVSIKKDIEVKKFRTKLLLQERDKKSAKVRHLRQKYTNLLDENEEKSSITMDNYRQLSKDSDKLKEWKLEELHIKENLQHTLLQLHHRQKQLMIQLLDIYPISSTPDNKFFIQNVYLPNSDVFYDSSESSLPVALGYVAHVLLMCSSFLQVPLRYPIMYFGSRSHIIDHITASLVERDRDFPLYTRGKDKMQFTYAVYLLNKNIAQLRWLCGQHTPNLRGTLSNLLSLLQSKETRTPSRCYFLNRHENVLSSSSVTSDPSLSSDQASINELRPRNCKDLMEGKSSNTLVSHQNPSEPLHPKPFGCKSPTRKGNRRYDRCDNQENLGLSQILSVPEAYMNKQISSGDFKTYLAKRKLNDCDTVDSKDTTKLEDVEQGTDIINSCNSTTPPVLEVKSDDLKVIARLGSDNCLTTKVIKQRRRKSRSVGSFTDEENCLDVISSFEVGSDPLINISSEIEGNVLNNELGITFSVENSQQDFLQKWLNNGTVLVSSDENIFHDETTSESSKVSASPSSNETTLNERTTALLSKTSFNLVKPK